MASRACIRLKKRVHRLVAKVHAYHKLMRPYKHAVTRNIEKLWTPSSVVIKAHRYKKKMDKKKLKAKRPTKKKTKKNSAKVKATAAALASRRRRSWMHFNPFKNSLKKKRAARKKRAKSKGKAKRQLKLHGTFRSQAKAALGGAHIHIRKRGTYKKLSPDQKCAFYMRQARTLGKAAGSHPLKSTRKGKMLGSVRLPVSMLRKIAHAKKYLKRHCRNGRHFGHDDEDDEYHEDTSDDD